MARDPWRLKDAAKGLAATKSAYADSQPLTGGCAPRRGFNRRRLFASILRMGNYRYGLAHFSASTLAFAGASALYYNV